MHCGDRTLFVIVQPAGALGGVLRVSPVTSLKSPPSSAVVGTVMFCGLADCRILFHSWPAKKKSLLRTIGPPRFHPKSLNRSEGFTAGEVGVAFNLEATLIASNLSLRTYSKPPP